MKSPVAVSIIVPVYNVAEYLPKCIESILNQTLKNIEVILVDDGSPDSSPELCDKYSKQDNRVKVIHKINEGLGYARNSGLEVAQGEYVGFVDSDDYIDPSMYEKLYLAAKKVDADYVRCENYIVTIDGKILNRDDKSYLHQGVYQKDEIMKNLIMPMFGKEIHEGKSADIGVSAWRILCRRELIEKNNIKFVSERELISEDIPFNLEVLLHAKLAVVLNERLYYYVANQNSLTQTYKPDRFIKEIIFYHSIKEMLRERNLYNQCNTRLKRFILDRARSCIRLEFLTNTGVSVKERKSNALKILNSKEVIEATNSIEINSMPIKYAVVTYLMKYKMVGVLYLMKNKI